MVLTLRTSHTLTTTTATTMVYAIGSLGHTLLNYSILDTKDGSGIPSLQLPDVGLDPVAGWRWNDTQVLANPDMLTSFEKLLNVKVDMKLPFGLDSLKVASSESLAKTSVETQTEARLRLGETVMMGTEAVFNVLPCSVDSSLQYRVGCQGPARADFEVHINENLSWIYQISGPTPIGPLLKALFSACLPSAGSEANNGFRVVQDDLTDSVHLEGFNNAYDGMGFAKEGAEILKQVIKNLTILGISNCVLTDANDHMLVVHHPSANILFLSPPINNGGLLSLQPGLESIPEDSLLVVQRPIGLALALCVIAKQEQSHLNQLPPDTACAHNATTDASACDTQPKRNVSAGDALFAGTLHAGVAYMPTSDERADIVTVLGTWALRLRFMLVESPSAPRAHIMELRGPYVVAADESLPTLRGLVIGHKQDSDIVTIAVTVYEDEAPFDDYSRVTPEIWKRTRAVMKDVDVSLGFPPAALVGLQVGSGRLWTAYTALFREVDKHNQLILKLCFPGTFPDKEMYDGVYSRAQARLAAAREAYFYNGPLKHCQGNYIPKWHGLYGGLAPDQSGLHQGIEVWAVLQEDVGEAVAVEVLSVKNKYEILEAYHEIHKAGVLHCEANPRHWRKTGDHIRVIGFDCAKDLSLEPKSESKQACEFEIRRVRAILRLPDVSL